MTPHMSHDYLISFLLLYIGRKEKRRAKPINNKSEKERKREEVQNAAGKPSLEADGAFHSFFLRAFGVFAPPPPLPKINVPRWRRVILDAPKPLF